jgi:hypothetical protein
MKKVLIISSLLLCAVFARAQSTLYQCYNFYKNNQTEYLLFKSSENTWYYYSSNTPKKVKLINNSSQGGWNVSFAGENKVYKLRMSPDRANMTCYNPDGTKQNYTKVSD